MRGKCAAENSDTFAFLLALLFCCCFFARVALLLRQFVAFLLVVACLLTISYCFFALLLLCSELYIAFLRCCFVAVAFLLVLLFCSAKTYSATKQHKQKSNWASNGLLFCSCSQQLLRVAPCYLRVKNKLCKMTKYRNGKKIEVSQTPTLSVQ